MALMRTAILGQLLASIALSCQPGEAQPPLEPVDPLQCAGGRLDGSTGLCWQHPPATAPESGGFTWRQAALLCERLSLARHEDWRLPDRGDFIALLQGCDGSVGEGDTGECNTCAKSVSCAALFGPDTGWYWSSSPMDEEPGIAWDVRFDLGLLVGGGVDDSSGVRCVRSTR